jgi:hypothetical protein
MATILTYVDTSMVSMTGANPVGNKVTIPASTLAANDDVEIWGGLYRSTGTDTPVLDIYFGSSSARIADYTVVAADTFRTG